MATKFRYGCFDKAVWYISLLTIAVLAGIAAHLFDVSDGSDYLAVWFICIASAVIIICLLSVPTRIIVDDKAVELRCMADSTYIPLDSIIDIEPLGRKGFRNKIPMGGIFGFWGYYGWYLDIKTHRFHMVYAANRSKTVAIHTSHRRYLLSCREPKALVEAILQARTHSGNTIA